MATKERMGLEAQQRYLSYQAKRVAIVSQHSLVLVFMGLAQLSQNMFSYGVSHRAACVKLSAKGVLFYCTISGDH